MFLLCFPCPISVFMPLNLCQPSDHRVFQCSQFLITFNFLVLPFFPLKQMPHFSSFYLGEPPFEGFCFPIQIFIWYIFHISCYTTYQTTNSLQIFYNFQCNFSFSFLTFYFIYLISSNPQSQTTDISILSYLIMKPRLQILSCQYCHLLEKFWQRHQHLLAGDLGKII